MENVSSKSNKSLKLNGPAFDLSNVAAFQIPIYLGEFDKYEGGKYIVLLKKHLLPQPDQGILITLSPLTSARWFFSVIGSPKYLVTTIRSRILIFPSIFISHLGPVKIFSSGVGNSSTISISRFGTTDGSSIPLTIAKRTIAGRENHFTNPFCFEFDRQ